ncbi:MAG: hypothetical protein M3R49_08625 [Chloroflexota bacterium]|nr:hypothetical protein [Chloroflexota bacterium]
MNDDAMIHLLRAVAALSPDEVRVAHDVQAAVERAHLRGFLGQDEVANLASRIEEVSAAIREAIDTG